MGDSFLVRMKRWLWREPPRTVELSEEEMAATIDRQTRELLDMNSESFIVALNEGSLDRTDWPWSTSLVSSSKPARSVQAAIERHYESMRLSIHCLSPNAYWVMPSDKKVGSSIPDVP